jgi:hypothetical protein
VNEKSLNQTELNLQSNYGAFLYRNTYDFLGSFYGQGNPLPENILNGHGQLIYSEYRQQLYLQEVNEALNLTEKFTLLLPEFDNLISFRQFFTTQGTIIAGVSYMYKGKSTFTLRELRLDGKVVK